MPRKKVEKIKLSARLSENNASRDDLDFIKEKIRKGYPKSVIIREAITAYRLMEENLKPMVEAGKEQDNTEENQEIYNKLDNIVSSGDFGLEG